MQSEEMIQVNDSNLSQAIEEISQQKSVERNIKDNITYRQLAKEVEDLRQDIASRDLEEISNARRNFESQYNDSRNKEVELQGHLSNLSGQILGLKQRIESDRNDLTRDYNNIDGRYSDQLIKVKVWRVPFEMSQLLIQLHRLLD